MAHKTKRINKKKIEADKESMRSSASSFRINSFQDVLTNTPLQVIIEFSISPIISQIVQAITQLLQIGLIYYYLGYYQVISFVKTWIFMMLMKHIIQTPILCSNKYIQDRIVAEQWVVADIIYQHSVTITVILGIIIFTFMMVFGTKLSSIGVIGSDTEYFPIMIKGMPLLFSAQSLLLVLITENNQHVLNMFEITRSATHILILYFVLVVLKTNNSTITFSLFAYIDLIRNCLFSLVCLYMLTRKHKKQQITQFSIRFRNFKPLQFPIIKTVIKWMFVYYLYTSWTNISIILALYLNSKEFDAHVIQGNYLALIFIFSFQDISQSIYKATESALHQIIMPNISMKKFDRVYKFMVQGFLMLFTVQIIVNIILLILCNKIITIIFYDVSYEAKVGLFTNSQYSTMSYYYIKYICVESMLKMFKMFVLCIAKAMSTLNIHLMLLFCQITVTIGVFLVNYFSRNIMPIQQYLATHIAIDICFMMPYYVLLLKIRHLSNKINSSVEHLALDLAKENNSGKSSAKNAPPAFKLPENNFTANQISQSSVEYKKADKDDSITNQLLQSDSDQSKKLSEVLMSSVDMNLSRYEESELVDSIQSSDLDDGIVQQVAKKPKPKKPQKLIEKGKMQIPSYFDMEEVDLEPLPKMSVDPSVSAFFQK
ncbi:MatE_and transmembrane domain-containing protein [Hexamita inflata]|uniref:MatE and transmembrane domain-containing protein n=1 Tax=Hexamita inflata TaxID=28002 RepID=A0AA86QCJ4_9EUKA|nr:MatE and transmembrane domain-containing protein [Hexamita inflata]